jgi:GH15 family glucan-1,4-alpha-glucosidase
LIDCSPVHQTSNDTPATPPIESYGMIGDCNTAALVGRDGSIDWLCWPRFDSGAMFARLLGTPEHGRWRIGPAEGEEASERRYRGNTLILETRFTAKKGEVEVIDFMPIGDGIHLIRLVKGLSGCVHMEMELVIRFGYGHDLPWMRRIDGDGDGGSALLAVAGPDMAVLRTPVETRGKDMRTIAEFDVSAGETIPFILSYAPSYSGRPRAPDPEKALAATEKFWTGWCNSNHLAGQRSPKVQDAVLRSLLTLKALAYAPTGGIVAAATTSLPEAPGGPRNWDYRFCWIRDATISLLALMDAGYYDEALAWRDWLLRAAAGSPDQIQIMYGIAGERRLTEWTVPWLPGYAGSAPVRIGNAAHAQLQLDVFGELMDALHQGRVGGLPESEPAWELQRTLAAHLARIWHKPDRGLWEVRGEPQHFTHSKVMAWVAFDRCIRTAEQFKLPGPLDEWRRQRDTIRADIDAHAFDPERGAYMESYGSKNLDASMLLLPALGFLDAADPRFRSTVAAIESDLVTDGLVRRYDVGRTRDGIGGGEGSFLACSFWLADAYIMLGRRDDAEALFDRLLGLRNDLGLLAEEYDARSGRQLGNFPQAYSHVALLNTARRLARPGKRQARSPTDQA